MERLPKVIMKPTRYGRGNARLKESSSDSTAGSPSIALASRHQVASGEAGSECCVRRAVGGRLLEFSVLGVEKSGECSSCRRDGDGAATATRVSLRLPGSTCPEP